MNRPDLDKAVEELSGKYPYYKTFMTGVVTFLVGCSIVYIGQEMLKTVLPYGRKSFLIATIVVGSVASYYITRKNTQICQDMWMALEEKHSVLTPLEERENEKKMP